MDLSNLENGPAVQHLAPQSDLVLSCALCCKPDSRALPKPVTRIAHGWGCCPTAYLVNQCADTAGLQAVVAGTTSKRGMGAWCVCVTQTQTQTPTAHLWVKQLRVDAALSTRKRAPLSKGACIHSTGFCAIWGCISSSSSSDKLVFEAW